MAKEDGRGKRAKEMAIERYVLTDEKWGVEIENWSLEGVHLAEILRRTGLKLTFVRRYLRWKGEEVTERIRLNGIAVNKENAVKNGRLSAISLSGVEFKPLTGEIVDLFLKLKDEGLHLAEIKRRMSVRGFMSKKVYQLCRLYGKPKRKSNIGAENPAYGKPPSKNCGKGISGHILIGNDVFFFRSILEMRIFIFLEESGVKFVLCKHRIPYKVRDTERTYQPDLVIEKKIYEIKPEKMVEYDLNKEKFRAASEYCKKFNLEFGIITENTFDLPILSMDKAKKMFFDKKVVMNPKQTDRFFNALRKGWIR